MVEGSRIPGVQTPQVAFLGVCDRASKVRNLVQGFSALNILGLKSDLFSVVYPGTLGHVSLLFAVYEPSELGTATIHCESRSSPDTYNFQISLEFRKEAVPPEDPYEFEALLVPTEPRWVPLVLPFPESHRMIPVPDCLDFFLVREVEKLPIGSLRFRHVEAAPMTPDRLAAIRSHPGAAKFARIRLKCKK